MAVTRINHFESKVGADQALYEFLQNVIAIVKGCDGCIDCSLLRSVDSTESLVIIEQWSSIEAHQKAAKVIPPEQMSEVFPLLAKPPAGVYYRAGS